MPISPFEFCAICNQPAEKVDGHIPVGWVRIRVMTFTRAYYDGPKAEFHSRTLEPSLYCCVECNKNDLVLTLTTKKKEESING